RLKHRIDPRFVLERRITCTSQTREKSPPERIAREEPMEMTAGDAPVARNRAIRAAIEAQHRALGIDSGGAAKMHLIATNQRAGQRVEALRGDKALLAREFGLDLEQAEALFDARRAFDAVRIGDAAAEHLIAGANAENAAATPRMGVQIDIPALAAQYREIGARRLGTRQDHQIAHWQGPSRHDEIELDAAFGAQRIEIVEIGDMGEERNGDRHGAVARRRGG